MAENFATLIPGYDSHEVGRDFKGLYTLLGPDYVDLEPDPIGMTAVIVEAESNSWSLEIAQNAWSEFFADTFGARPDELEWWKPVFSGGDHELFKSYIEWLSYLERRIPESVAKQMHWRMEIADQFYALRMIPCRVVESACDRCARPYGWTLVSASFLFPRTKPESAMHRRWNPQMPNALDKQQAFQSHNNGDPNEFQEKCRITWESFKAVEDEDEFNGVTFDDLPDSGYEDWIDEVERQTAQEGVAAIQGEHFRLVYPPVDLINRINDELDTQYDVMSKRFQRKHPFSMVPEVLERWAEAVATEMELRNVTNSYA